MTAPVATVRTTQTATVTSDALLHIFTAVNGKLRCPASGEITRTGRKDVGLVTCPECHGDYPTRR
jgi:hypothetical protein